MSRLVILVFSTVALGFHGDARAQWRVGASIGGFSSSTFDFEGSESKVTAFSLGGDSALVAGYEVSEAVEIGATIGFATSNLETPDDVSQTESSNGLGVYLDYHFNPGEDTVFFAGARLGSGSSKTEVDGETYGESDLASYGVAGGVKHFLARNISLDVTASYSFGTVESGDAEIDLTAMGLGFGFSARL